METSLKVCLDRQLLSLIVLKMNLTFALGLSQAAMYILTLFLHMLCICSQCAHMVIVSIFTKYWVMSEIFTSWFSQRSQDRCCIKQFHLERFWSNWSDYQKYFGKKRLVYGMAVTKTVKVTSFGQLVSMFMSFPSYLQLTGLRTH